MEKKLIENPQNNPERKVVEVYPPEKKDYVVHLQKCAQKCYSFHLYLMIWSFDHLKTMKKI